VRVGLGDHRNSLGSVSIAGGQQKTNRDED